MRPIVCLLATLVVGLLIAPACGQPPQRPKQPREQMPKEVKLLAVGRGVVQVQTEDGKQWLVALGRNPAQTVSVVGKADPSWLQPGMLVRFSARFDRKGEAISKIEDLSVITLREGMRFGLTPENLPTANLAGAAAGGLFSDTDQDAKPKKPSRPKKIKPEDISYTVIGKIAKVKRNELSIAAGRLLKIELAEEPRIDVDVADLSLTPMGVTVSLDAWYYPQMPGRAMAERLTVALEKTLQDEKKLRQLAAAAAARAQEAGEKDEDDTPDKEKTTDKLDEKDPFGIDK